MFTLPLKQTHLGDSLGVGKSSKAPFSGLAEFSSFLRIDHASHPATAAGLIISLICLNIPGARS
jgi:hypothetical protein